MMGSDHDHDPRPPVLRRSKALSVSPLKASATIGASLAFMGIDRAMPLMHGAQGCTAFGKVFFVRHFREPIPLQTTAMDQISSVMGADENIVEALQAVCSKQQTELDRPADDRAGRDAGGRHPRSGEAVPRASSRVRQHRRRAR